MANYTIQRSLLASGDVTVTEATANTDTNVTLVGQNFTGYGDEIATNFLQMLENFASDAAPEVNPRVPGSTAIAGQLWYDTTNATIKVFDGSAWDEMAPTNIATGEDYTLRWNNINKRYQPEERVRITDGGSLIIANAATLANAVTITQNGTDLNYSFAGTTDLNFSGLTGNVVADSGAGFTSTLGGASITVAHDSTDVNFTHVGTTDWNVSGITAVNLNGGIYFDFEEMVDPAFGVDAGRGKLWVKDDAPNTLWFTDDAGTDWQLNTAASAVTELNDLTDVTLTAPDNNSLLYRSGGVYIDSNIANLSFDGTNLAATQIVGIPAANLIDRASPGTISGAPTFTAATTALTATLGDIRVQGGFGFVTSDGATSFAVRADTGTNDIQFTHANTPDWNISGLGQILVDGANVLIDSNGTALDLRGGFFASNSSNDVQLRFSGSDGVTSATVGVETGAKALRLKGHAIDATASVQIYGNNSVVLMETTSQLIGRHSGNNSAFITQNPTTAGNTTSLTIYDGRDVTTGSGGYDVGLNGTPQKTDTTGSFTADYDDVGKYCRITVNSSTVTLPANANIPTGGQFLVHNDTTGNISITQTSGTNIEWIDGSGADKSAATYTIARNSIVTVRKKDGTTWQIWGNGIS